MTTSANPIRTPIVEKTAASKEVLELKCEGTPRHCCMSIKKVSPRNVSPAVPQ